MYVNTEINYITSIKVMQVKSCYEMSYNPISPQEINFIQICWGKGGSINTPFAVHLRKIYIHLCQQLKLYSKYRFISTSMNFINANELSITLLAYVLIFNSIHG